MAILQKLKCSAVRKEGRDERSSCRVPQFWRICKLFALLLIQGLIHSMFALPFWVTAARLHVLWTKHRQLRLVDASLVNGTLVISTRSTQLRHLSLEILACIVTQTCALDVRVLKALEATEATLRFSNSFIDNHKRMCMNPVWICFLEGPLTTMPHKLRLHWGPNSCYRDGKDLSSCTQTWVRTLLGLGTFGNLRICGRNRLGCIQKSLLLQHRKREKKTLVEYVWIKESSLVQDFLLSSFLLSDLCTQLKRM